MAGDGFPGFPKEAVKFLSDLKANNTRDWFTANKATYETAIKQPAAHFCDAMSARLEKMTGTSVHAEGLPHTQRSAFLQGQDTLQRAPPHLLHARDRPDLTALLVLRARAQADCTGCGNFRVRQTSAGRIPGAGRQSGRQEAGEAIGKARDPRRPHRRTGPQTRAHGLCPGPPSCRSLAEKGHQRLARYQGHKISKQP